VTVACVATLLTPRALLQNGPFTDAGDVLKIDGLTDAQKEVLYKYKDNLVAFPPAPEVSAAPPPPFPSRDMCCLCSCRQVLRSF
jgi:hypothetical protein